MSTPVEQFVPEDFQQQIATGGSVDQKAAAAAQLAYQNTKGQRDRARAEQLRYEGMAKKTKDKRLQARYKSLANGAGRQFVKLRSDTVSAQNKLFEASGQYDRLLSGENRDAFMALKSLFNGFGLGSLAGKIYDYVKQGYGADTIAVLLQDTREYKARFAGNEARTKAGLPVLSPADYLATENAYRQVLSSAGLPKGFYDNPADFTKWISDDVSPTEIKSRVDLAVAATTQANPEYKNALFKMYGINEADLTAYFLDRKRAEPILKKQAAAGAIGAAAIRRGFAASTLDLEGYATLGITADQAEQAYAQISEGWDSMLGIAGRYGSSWTQREAEQEVFTPGASGSLSGQSAAEKGKRLKSQERALFAGGRGATTQGLNAGYSQT